MALDELPTFLQSVVRKYPAVWSAYNQLGSEIAKAGPLDEKQQRLVKLAVAIGGGREGAVHSHVRRGLAAGLTRDQLLHVGLLAATTIGWPAAIAALSWIEDSLQDAS